MKKATLAVILAVTMAAAALPGCGKKENEKEASKTEAAEETGPEDEEAGGEDRGEKLTKHQQELADMVYEQLVNEDYEAIYEHLVLPENAVLTPDDINNLYANLFDMGRAKTGEKTKKSKMDERFLNGCIMFEYGYDDGNSWTVGIIEDDNAPGGYEIVLRGLNSGHMAREYEERHLVLPSGLTDVTVRGVNLDRFVDDTYFDGAKDLDFDVMSYTAYKVVLPQHKFSDYDISTRGNGDEFRNFNIVVKAMSPFGEVTGLADYNNSRIELNLGDCSADMCYTQDSEEVKKMLAELLQGVFDRVSEGDFDIESYRGFFAEGTDDQIIQEQIDSLFSEVNVVTGDGQFIRNIKVGEISIYEDDGTTSCPKAEYVGRDRITMTVSAPVSYDDSLTFDGSVNHRECRKDITCQVKKEDGVMKFTAFEDENSLAYLLNYI